MPKASTQIPPLYFDSSGSARARFAGKPVEVGVHWCNAVVAYRRLVCPDTILPEEKRCLFCRATGGVPTMKAVAVAWDLNMLRWSVYMGTKQSFGEIWAASRAQGVTEMMMEAGNGVEIIIQRIGKSSLAVAVPDAMRRPLEQDPPAADGILRGIVSKSIWTMYSTAAEAEGYFQTRDASLDSDVARANEEIATRLATASKSKKATPQIDPATLIGRDRWDFMA